MFGSAMGIFWEPAHMKKDLLERAYLEVADYSPVSETGKSEGKAVMFILAFP